jgi:hypothetical protein
VPVDDPLFNKLSYPQWLWYSAQFAADDKENFELLRDVAEHNASFWNPEGVDQVRRAREKTFIVSDKDFNKQLEEAFGRKLNIPERKEGLVFPNADVEKIERPKMRENVDASAYLDAELDEVRFIPMEK